MRFRFEVGVAMLLAFLPLGTACTQSPSARHLTSGYHPSAHECANASTYTPPQDAATNAVRMHLELNQSAEFKPIAICLLLDGKAVFLEHDASGAMFTRGTILEPTVHIAREGKHFVQIAMWMHGAGALQGYALQLVSSHEFVLGGPGESALRISLIDRDALSNPRDRLDIRWVDDGAVRSANPTDASR